MPTRSSLGILPAFLSFSIIRYALPSSVETKAEETYLALLPYGKDMQSICPVDQEFLNNCVFDVFLYYLMELVVALHVSCLKHHA